MMSIQYWNAIVMASGELVRKEDDNLNQFDRARREIRDKFARAHHLLQEREAVLLAEQELEVESALRLLALRGNPPEAPFGRLGYIY